jgi:hypothetical protein
MNPYARITLNFGGVCALLTFVIFIALFYSGYYPLGNSGLLGSWIVIVSMVMGVRHYRNEYCEGYLSYGRCLLLGLCISCASAFLFDALVFGFGLLVVPDFRDIHIDYLLTEFEKMEGIVGSGFYDTLMDEFEKNAEQTTMGSIALGDFFSKITGGFIVSLIAAAFLKKSRPFFYQKETE